MSPHFIVCMCFVLTMITLEPAESLLCAACNIPNIRAPCSRDRPCNNVESRCALITTTGRNPEPEFRALCASKNFFDSHRGGCITTAEGSKQVTTCTIFCTRDNCNDPHF